MRWETLLVHRTLPSALVTWRAGPFLSLQQQQHGQASNASKMSKQYFNRAIFIYTHLQTHLYTSTHTNMNTTHAPRYFRRDGALQTSQSESYVNDLYLFLFIF